MVRVLLMCALFAAFGAAVWGEANSEESRWLYECHKVHPWKGFSAPFDYCTREWMRRK